MMYTICTATPTTPIILPTNFFGMPINSTTLATIYSQTGRTVNATSLMNPNDIAFRGRDSTDPLYILEVLAYCKPEEFNEFIFQHIKNRWNISYEKLHPREYDEACMAKILEDDKFILPDGIYKLPGGSELYILTNDSYYIEDRNHKTTYKAHTKREFNPYINVSDILDKFMAYIAKLKISKKDFMNLPIKYFMMWLVIEAAKHDDEPEPPDIKYDLDLALSDYVDITPKAA